MDVKNIIFDIGGVLAAPKSGHWFITTNFWNIIDKSKVNEVKLKDSLKKYLYLQTQEPKTELEEHDMFSNYYYEVLKEIEYPNLTKEIANKIADDCVYNDDKFIFYDDVKKVIEELSKEYNLYIISNGWPSSFRVLKNKRLDSYFKGIFISSMYSTTKEERLFDIFLDKYKNINPKESLYIDDRRHILTKAKRYGFNLLLMDRKKVYSDSNFKKINDLDSIISILFCIDDEDCEKHIPESVLEYGFDFDWDEKDVWKLDYPTQEIVMEILEWHFDIPFWNFNNEWYVLKPRDVIDNPEKYKSQYDRIMESDISYPIDVMESKNRLVILDGLHRLVKCKLLGMNRVNVRIIPRSEIPNISK